MKIFYSNISSEQEQINSNISMEVGGGRAGGQIL